jgi:2-polyprenyl-3-methyl-5-hydroxy-6-metoxy-1,4-benzoquinol methylase
MTRLHACPGCKSHNLVPFSFTVPEERGRDLHFAQTRCRNCDLVFSNPVAGEEELERFYRSEYYEHHEREYNALDPQLERLVRDRARHEAEGLRGSVLPFVTSGRFFEIGAGYGALLGGARELGFEVAGVEPSARAAAFAREVMGLSDVREGPFRPGDWPAASFDVVYSFQVIEHVADPHAFAAGIFHLLKPGALAVVGTENHHNAWVAVRRARSWLKGRRLPEFQTAAHHTFYFSGRSLSRLVERHGLTAERCLVYTPSIEEKLPRYQFRHWYGKAAFYALHYADVLLGRGGRVLLWCRRPAALGAAT